MIMLSNTASWTPNHGISLDYERHSLSIIFKTKNEDPSFNEQTIKYLYSFHNLISLFGTVYLHKLFKDFIVLKTFLVMYLFDIS